MSFVLCRLRLEMFGPTHFLYADTMFALGNIQLKQADLSKRKEEQGQAKEVTTWM